MVGLGSLKGRVTWYKIDGRYDDGNISLDERNILVNGGLYTIRHGQMKRAHDPDGEKRDFSCVSARWSTVKTVGVSKGVRKPADIWIICSFSGRIPSPSSTMVMRPLLKSTKAATDFAFPAMPE
jgi:hypothetical protein